jgi:hypothetical protein
LTNNLPGQPSVGFDIMLWKISSVVVTVSGIGIAWLTKGKLGLQVSEES